MPGLQESLGLNSDSLEDLVSGDSDFELPESLEITADVENFSLDLPSPLHLTMFSTPSIPTTSPDTMT